MLLLCGAGLARAADAPPEFERDIQPLLTKYCAGCHNADEREGKLSLESFDELQRGGERGAAVVPGDADASRLLRTLTGKAEPAMPPEDNPRPSEAEIEVLRRWVAAGATGPAGRSPRRVLAAPKIEPSAANTPPVTALDWSADGLLAVGVQDHVELRRPGQQSPPRRLETNGAAAGEQGAVVDGINALRFSSDGGRLVAAGGTPGLVGVATIWSVADGAVVRRIEGHRDTLYAAVLSPDGTMLATGSYDQRVILWDVASGRELRTLTGHNGAIYDLDFSPDGAMLASAGADQTIKLWRVADGERLDTLGQPLKEQFAVRFSPDGQYVVGGGADNRIRVWRLVSRTKPEINPLVHARFAHEGAVTRLAFTRDGATLVSTADDRTVKLWETRDYTQYQLYPPQPDVVASLAVAPDGLLAAVGHMDGSLEILTMTAPPRRDGRAATSVVAAAAIMPETPLAEVAESEPNSGLTTAQPLTLPTKVTGAIEGEGGDVDLFRVSARAGETWMLEIDAARSKSPLDSRIDVLHLDGTPVQRLVLRAVRDSYFTFRGKDSNTSDDFRVQNWREMELNEYLYCNGEVVRLWHYPRGPDSGFIVYPGSGQRRTYFGTSPLSHPLGEPCYIVEPLPVGANPIPNGLPLFPVYYQNDDDGLRRWGTDSRLDFVAPEDGEYLVRVSDVRGLEGEAFKYTLTIRPARPDFQVALGGANPVVSPGSGKEFSVTATRLDGFAGPIDLRIEGLPPGFHCSSPLQIEAGQDTALGVIYADADAPAPTPENAKQTRITAVATIDGREVSHDVGGLGELKLGEPAKLLVRVSRVGDEDDAAAGPVELTIAPGETIRAEVHAERREFDARVSFGNHDSGRNMPHGVFVDNIGLNGLMIVEGQTKREFFITAAPWVPEGARVFHLRTTDAGTQTTLPVLLRVARPR